MRDRIHARLLRMKGDRWIWMLSGTGLVIWLLCNIFPAWGLRISLVATIVVGDHAHYILRRRHRVIPTATARERREP